MFIRKVLPGFHDCAVRAAAGEANPWTAGLRVKPVEGAEGVWEMTWSMREPDGRATWEWVTIDGEPGIRWRRLGTHEVFRSP